MTEKSVERALTLDWIFGPPPLLKGEDMSAYQELLARVRSDVKPSDVIEHFWVRDVVDLMFEILRWRRLRTIFLNSAVAKVRDEALDSVVADELNRLAKQRCSSQSCSFQSGPEKGYFLQIAQQVREELERRKAASEEREPEPELSFYEWRERLEQDPAVARKLRKVRKSAELNLDIEVLTAEEFVGKLETIERIDHLAMVAEGRLNVILREVDRRRAVFAETLRETVHAVEDAEFETIEPKKTIPRYRLTKYAT